MCRADEHRARFDDDRFHRHVGVRAGLRPVGTFAMRSTTSMPLTTLPNTRVAVALGVGAREIEAVVVGDVDEELRGRRMRVGACAPSRPCRRVAQAVAGFVLDRRARRLLAASRGVKPPPWIMKPGMTRWKIVPL